MVYENPKFDLNEHPSALSYNDEANKDSCFDDTALRLECFGHVRQEDVKSAPKDGCGLVLGLGPASRVNERDLVLKLGLSHCSTSFQSDPNSSSNHQSCSSVEVSNEFGFDHEGSTSSKSSGGYMPSLILAPRISGPLQKLRISEPELSIGSDFSTETASDHQTRGKMYEFSGCSHPTGCRKAARGTSGLCVDHDGDRRCCFRGCVKGAQESTMFCKVHGGGMRRVFTGGTKGAEGGTSTLLCKAPGSGKRFLYDKGGVCTKSAHDGTDICVVKDTDENKDFHGVTPRLFYRVVLGPGPGSPDNHSLSGSSVVSNSACSLGKPAKRRQMIPPQVLVPSSMKSSFSPFTRKSSSVTDDGRKSLELMTQEDRVHGGSLLSFDDGNLREAVIDEI
ncbi:hypothetical protein HanRHA438_Chr10g0455681 [Helianthus annuus]|uniref:Uncharacterized protein n=1 Tax=Helianthus annuus TaxID=4232 RepID=A0A251TJJ2_HELAN|nr:hypothetical protein HanXRQr2_Chr10g0443391 [Helianthus annuus]KAJ0514020.1 hypothetical protein HanHA300_Chr10g0364611 [Helianthus annuus]KAJ0522050.1 hypothetical protein HanIR_Chr10g0478071 [Helianthus annuus]KAJ0530147.1 hypothetical protein HanHA89_Chr10g0386321 [Helianthus annuus]KAJ0697008.1 hypothetical protein HanLR1_Chr10g0363871 [Helianthus annuus]